MTVWTPQESPEREKQRKSQKRAGEEVIKGSGRAGGMTWDR